ncbi:MAG TPA: acetate/propionate family kinase [Alphaproteobacteria bacterium]|nr:acetate/propionate family kinase [Alphaproteobacteria bacterium]
MTAKKTGAILALNAGSSSVKFSLFVRGNDLPLVAHGAVTGIGGAPEFCAGDKGGAPATEKLAQSATQEDGLRAIIDWVHGHESGWQIAAVAHRIVHGGTEFTGPVRIDADVLQRLKKLISLAPLHQPHNLAAVEIAEHFLPNVPQIACFDTAFHVKHDPLFSSFALPQDLRDKGVRRYGFHGLSYEWIAETLRRAHPDLAKDRVVVAHLGNGASLCAMQNGRSIDTTMGMTALDGLPMGTRCGALDAGAVIYMIRDLGLAADELEHVLYEKSGLKGLSGLSNDVKTLLESPDPKAKFALDYFVLKTAQYMAMMVVSMGGTDGIVFTGGIGENAGPVREAVVKRLAVLGQPPILVIPANEERMMAMQSSTVLDQA